MMSLSHQTRIAISLVMEDDTGQVAQFLAVVTALMGLLLKFSRWTASAVVWITDFIEAVDFTLKVFSIGVNALVFGLGVRI
ncbi:MAG: hypothetical protein FOGNACKC_01969 [Anaerolineae bacterium]|nr:hypothetical protein [Anaerolineae bacterium]